ncbi:unnamed protein product [Boreogadus saida]
MLGFLRATAGVCRPPSPGSSSTDPWQQLSSPGISTTNTFPSPDLSLPEHHRSWPRPPAEAPHTITRCTGAGPG